MAENEKIIGRVKDGFALQNALYVPAGDPNFYPVVKSKASDDASVFQKDKRFAGFGIRFSRVDLL